MATNTVTAADGTKRAVRKPLPFKPTHGPKSINVEINTLWPLASEAWMNYTQEKGGANMFHFRMGPFYGDVDHESEWSGIGGPYLGGPGSDWNPAFWDKYRALLSHARKIGANVEVNVIDTWYCKHAQWGDQQIPWPAADIEACGRQSSPEQEKYIRKVVSEAKDAPHVIWITDNEGGEIQGTKCSWYEWARSVIRDEEARSGGEVRMVGTNNTNCGGGPFDYVATHAKAPLTSPLFGKHTENNERNPAFSPEQEHANMCSARAAGLHWWFWRAEMSDQDFERTLALFKSGCGGPVGCFPPPDNDPLWGENVTGAGQKKVAVEAAKVTVGERCGSIPPHEAGNATLDALGVELRSRSECAGRSVDSVFILAPDGWWEEYHAVRYTDGCWADNPAVLPKYRWRYLGTNPSPSPACGEPQPPPVMQWNVKEHTKGPNKTVVDSTPLVGPASYCASIGFTDGRSRCPVRMEGAPDRVACEVQAVGSPQWSGPGQQSPENPYQFWVLRDVSGTARVCSSLVPSVCGSVEVTP